MAMKPGMKMLAMAKATRMGDEPEMRRRRDSRGRYMEGGDGSSMTYGRTESAYRPWPDPHIPPSSRMGDTPSRMRDRNVVNFRDYQDRRRIGFVPNMEDDDEEETEMRKYGRRYDPDRPVMHHGASHEGETHMGMAEGDDEHLAREKAEKWVKGMQGADGKRGGRWTYEEIERYAPNFGIQREEIVDFYAVLNALYTDYGKVAKKYGFDRMEVWAELAKAFMHDSDAEPGKVKTYYECIAKHDD